MKPQLLASSLINKNNNPNDDVALLITYHLNGYPYAIIYDDIVWFPFIVPDFRVTYKEHSCSCIVASEEIITDLKSEIDAFWEALK